MVTNNLLNIVNAYVKFPGGNTNLGLRAKLTILKLDKNDWILKISFSSLRTFSLLEYRIRLGLY